MTIAALPMYDFAELRDATNALWSAIAAHLARAGVEAPMSLTRGGALDALWMDGSLLLAQTCGYPLVTTLANRVALLATPCYGAPGCEGADYRSVIVVRAGDPAASLAALRHRRCAVNGTDSNSGMNLLRAAVAPLAGGEPAFFAQTIVTGSHAASVRAVADGRADVAAIDCVTWAHLAHLRPDETRPLHVLATTRSTPGLPLITALSTPPATRQALRAALDHVARDPALAAVRGALRLDGIKVLPLAAYDAVLTLEQEAAAAGYPELA